ncbi:esterase [Lithospermum erythrorhizon]|uniref:pectinesterase n=1 Tax=Lithospermum erythrorhizon TaxID=34254 RepID=A0AAV3PP23_LITER
MFNFKRKTKLLLTALPISFILLTLLFTLSKTKSTTTKSHIHIHVHKNIQIAQTSCDGTLYPELCVSTLTNFPDLHTKTLTEIISANVNYTMSEVKDSTINFTSLRKKLYKKIDPLDRQALEDCLELLADTVLELKTALGDLSPNKSVDKQYTDLQTLFSGAMTNQYTCLDGFAYSKKNVRKYFQKSLKKISKHVSNSLAMLKKLKKQRQKNSSGHHSEIFSEYGEVKSGFPTWVKKKERALLESTLNENKFDMVVAQDGSGNYSTINDALRAAPNASSTRFVIHIKAGAYFEYIEIERTKSNIMLVGDGIGKTWIKGNRSVVDGWTTFRSATVGEFSL